ncbi:uncharacterized protein LOC134755130 [Cydia strobilella]|uniref:uncharacterized protein LOC134755130 n=1 Tax=Cydia strobilella TaxID=1100964 RepID=UPI0030066AB6
MEKHLKKENLNKKQTKKAGTRIPVPLAPLPTLPGHLLNKSRQRPPMNTLSGSSGLTQNVPSSNLLCEAGPSNSKTKGLDTTFVINRPKGSFQMDTTFVIDRPKGSFQMDTTFVIDRPKSPFQIDTSFVETHPVARGCEDIDDFVTYQDEGSAIIISSDEEIHSPEPDKDGLANKKRISESAPDLD